MITLRRAVITGITVTLALSPGQGRTASVTLAPSKDNTLYESTQGSLSNGAGAHMFVGDTFNASRRAVMAFDVASSIPAGSTIKNAALKLHMSRTISGTQSVSLHRLSADWGEGASNAINEEGAGAAATPGDVTWLHTFYPNQFWLASAGDYSPLVSAAKTVGLALDFYTWGPTTEMTADLQAWLNGSAGNYGWILIGNEFSPGASKRFDTRENSNQSFRPALTVEFAPPPLDNPIPEPIAEGDISIGLVPVTDGLTAPNWGIAAPGYSNRLFVTDQSGVLWAIDLASGSKSVFLDVSARLVPLGVSGTGTFDERGLLGVAFHPAYQANGKLYTFTSEPATAPADFSTMPVGVAPNCNSVITEWHAPDPSNPNAVVDPTSARVLLRIAKPQFNHNAGALNFGPDGKLYIALGDGGNRDDEGDGHGATGNGRNPGTVLGAILRIDPEGSTAPNGQYAVPADNPFVLGSPPFGGAAGCGDGFCDEIHAYGFRNPFRFSFDSLTGDLHAADVGQGKIEEIDLVFPGGNYGWNFKEGSFFFEPNGNQPGFVTTYDPGNLPPGLIDPVAQYDHDEGISIIGGFVYRGEGIKELAGRYVFGDWSRQFSANNGRLFYLDSNNVIKELKLFGTSGLGLSLDGFGQDARGELYVLGNTTGTPFGQTGVVWKIAALCSGDIDRDGDVDGQDLRIIAAQLGSGSCNGACTGDINNDEAVDTLDVALFADNFGRSDCPIP